MKKNIFFTDFLSADFLQNLWEENKIAKVINVKVSLSNPFVYNANIGLHTSLEAFWTKKIFEPKFIPLPSMQN